MYEFKLQELIFRFYYFQFTQLVTYLENKTISEKNKNLKQKHAILV